MPATDYRPTLRAGVRLADGAAELLGRRVPLDGAGLALAAELDGSRSLEELGDDGLAVVRGLARLNLLEGAGDAIVARTAAPPPRALVLPEARFQCRSTGACCQGYSFGPLTAPDLARLAALDLAALAPGPWLRDKDGKRYLQTIDDQCVFLGPDRLCKIHAAHGAAAKPGFCQLYPVQVLATADGLKFYDHGECASFAVSAHDGTLLADEVPRLAGLLPAGRLALHHPVVTLAPGLTCDYGHFLALTEASCAAALTGPSAAAALASIARLQAEFVATLRSFTPGPGQPETALAELLAAPAAPAAPLPPSRLARVATIAQLLRRAILPGAEAARRQRHPLAEHLHAELADILAFLEAVARARAAPGRAQLTEPAQRALALPVPDDVDTALRLSIRHQLFGQRALIDDRLRPGSLRIAVSALVALLGAKLAAAAAGAPAVRLADFDRAHMIALRTLRQPPAETVFVAYEDDAATVQAGVAALV